MSSTEDLIRRLSQSPPPPPFGPRLLRALGLGFVAALLGAAVIGVRPDMPGAALTPAVMAKFIACGALAWMGIALVERLARPGAAVLDPGFLVPTALSGLSLAVLGAMDFPDRAHPDEQLACMLSIIGLALPGLWLTLSALQHGAAGSPGAAGAAAGLATGAIAAFAFVLHCPIEHGAAVLAWYGGAMTMLGALGAALGRLRLRW